MCRVRICRVGRAFVVLSFVLASLGNLGTLMAQTRGLLREVYQNIGGTSVDNLTSHESFPGRPTSEEVIDSFETPTNVDDDYGQRVSGYVLPPLTGDYVFWIASDDGGALYLSTDESPSNKKEIASVPGWTASRDWGKYPEQKSDPIRLVTGRRYYVEALMKERGGGDNLAVRWQLPNGTIEAPIPNRRLAPVSLGPPEITSQPENTTVTEGESAEFRVELSREIGASFQWQKNQVDIPGATAPVLELEDVPIGESGARFRVLVTNASGRVTSRMAVLTVRGDGAGPSLLSVQNLGSGNSLTVTFSELVEPSSATQAGNYRIDGGIRVLGARLAGAGDTVCVGHGSIDSRNPISFDGEQCS